jgi:hypothetical protein
MSPRWGSTPRLTDWLTVSRNVTLTLVEYLHRDPASRRRRKGKYQIWDSKIWSRVPSDSDPRKTTLARASSIYKRQTRTLAREGAPQKQDHNCQRIINIWSWAPDGAHHQDLLIDWPSVAMWLWTLTLTWERQRVSDSRVQDGAKSSEVKAKLRTKVKSEEWSMREHRKVWTVIIECNCDTDLK